MFMCTILFEGNYLYQKFENNNCSSTTNLGSLESDGPPNHDNCARWCINNRNCAGFIVHYGVCTFKDRSCNDNCCERAYGIDLFLIKGTQIIFHDKPIWPVGDPRFLKWQSPSRKGGGHKIIILANCSQKLNENIPAEMKCSFWELTQLKFYNNLTLLMWKLHIIFNTYYSKD